MDKKSSSSLNQKKKLNKPVPQNKIENETATGFGDKKLEGPDRPST